MVRACDGVRPRPSFNRCANSLAWVKLGNVANCGSEARPGRPTTALARMPSFPERIAVNATCAPTVVLSKYYLSNILERSIRYSFRQYDTSTIILIILISYQRRAARLAAGQPSQMWPAVPKEGLRSRRAAKTHLGWSLRVTGKGYDLILEDLTHKSRGYAAITDERGVIRVCHPWNFALDRSALGWHAFR